MESSNSQNSELDFTDCGLLKTLDRLRDDLANGKLSSKQKLLISELSIKNLFVERKLKLENLESDMLKYVLLGAYIYSHFDNEVLGTISDAQ